jgi:hypothetical protein
MDWRTINSAMRSLSQISLDLLALSQTLPSSDCDTTTSEQQQIVALPIFTN